MIPFISFYQWGSGQNTEGFINRKEAWSTTSGCGFFHIRERRQEGRHFSSNSTHSVHSYKQGDENGSFTKCMILIGEGIIHQNSLRTVCSVTLFMCENKNVRLLISFKWSYSFFLMAVADRKFFICWHEIDLQCLWVALQDFWCCDIDAVFTPDDKVGVKRISTERN